MNRFAKRAMDIALALLGLTLGAPLIALIALLVRLDSPGRAIFSQPRLGVGGRVFRMHKFRKFPDNWGTKGAAVTVAADARMTRLGRILERTKLDELPQLWNILRGEMSFVGPRPETPNFKDLFVGELAGVHEYVPGIFGPNQVAFRNESQLYPPDQDPETFYREQLFPQKARNDIAYFGRATLWSDIGWILRGLWYSVIGAVDWRRLIQRRGKVLLLDLLIIQGVWLGANILRFDGLPDARYWHVYVTGTWLIPLILIPALLLGGHYRGLARHFSASDAIRLGLSVCMGWALAYLSIMVVEARSASLGIALMATVLTLFMLGGVRILYREYLKRSANGSAGGKSDSSVLIYGAGHRGIALAGLMDHGIPNTRVMGFLDDNDRELVGRQMAGYPILGSERDLDTVHAVYQVDQLWTTFEPDQYKYLRLRDWCKRNDVVLVVLPLIPQFMALSEPSAISARTEQLDDDPSFGYVGSRGYALREPDEAVV